MFPSTKENLSDEEVLRLIKALNLPPTRPLHEWEDGITHEQMEQAQEQQRANERMASGVRRRLREKMTFLRLAASLVPGLASDLIFDHLLANVEGYSNEKVNLFGITLLVLLYALVSHVLWRVWRLLPLCMHVWFIYSGDGVLVPSVCVVVWFVCVMRKHHNPPPGVDYASPAYLLGSSSSVSTSKQWDYFEFMTTMTIIMLVSYFVFDGRYGWELSGV